MTTIYLIRHSKPLDLYNDVTNDSLQLQNEKKILSIEGEEFAKEKLSKLDNIDKVYASNFVRAIQTAKYISEDINIMDDLGERRFGINAWSELPEKFERKQFLDENYKIGDGESQKEVRTRMTNAINKIINDNKDKTIAVITHATALSYLLKNWCDIKLGDDKLIYSYKDKIILEGYIYYCDIFKLQFDDNNLINIEKI